MSHISVSNPACQICGETEGHQTHVATEMMFGMGSDFTYLECANCGCLQLLDAPADMQQYYPANYYSFTRKEETHARDFLQRVIDRCRVRLQKRYEATGRGWLGHLVNDRKPRESKLTILRPLSLKSSDAVLDVGCGSGALLDDLAEAGFVDLYGIDPFNAKDMKTPHGVQIARRSIFEVDGRFDVIMFHHSFEHISNPQETLIQVTKLLKDGGKCLIRIPVASSFAWKHYNTNWVQLDAPRHYFLHTEKSIRNIAANAGLEVTRIIYDSNSFQFWASEQYRRGIPLRDRRSLLESPRDHSFTSEELESYKAQAIELNRKGQGDQAAFFFVKGQGNAT